MSGPVWTAQGRIASYNNSNGLGEIRVENTPYSVEENFVKVTFNFHAVVRDKRDKRVAWVLLKPGTLVEFDAQPNGDGYGWSAHQVRLL